MGVLILLIIASLTVATGFLIAFIWSVRSGQYDDDYTPSIRMLFDDKKKSNKDESEWTAGRINHGRQGWQV